MNSCTKKTSIVRAERKKPYSVPYKIYHNDRCSYITLHLRRIDTRLNQVTKLNKSSYSSSDFI